MYYVYHLIDASTNLPFYVGKGRKHRNHRGIAHLYDAKRDPQLQENSLKCNKINKLLSLNIDIIITNVAEFDNEEDALLYEAADIAKFGKLCDNTGILTNILDGGTTPPKQPQKFVYCFNMVGELLHTFRSTQEASTILGVTPSVIQNCCAGRVHTSKGYAMFYYPNPTQPEVAYRFADRKTRHQVTYQMDNDHQIIRQFSSMKEAAASVGSDSRSISRAISNNFRHKSYYWALSPP
jgi:hypothetical protein